MLSNDWSNGIPNNAGSDGGLVSGASVLAHIGLQQKKLLGNMAEALA